MKDYYILYYEEYYIMKGFLYYGGAKGRGRSRKTWEQCVRDDMKLLGLHPEWAVFRDTYVEGLDLGQTSNPSLAWKNRRFKNK